MELWIPITIAAAFFQNLRSALQKHLKGQLSNSGAAYARFLYALPLAVIYLLGLATVGDFAWPQPNLRFFVFCLLGGVCQILFTVFLMWMFSFRSFAVGTTFSKLEIVMVAALGAVILGDTLSPTAVVAVLISTIGIAVLSAGQSGITLATLLAGLTQRATAIGLVCAAWLGGSVVFIRGAALALNHDEFIMTAGFALVVTLSMQTLLLGGWLVLREPGELARVLRAWRWAGAVGVAGMLSSVAWFTAFTLQNAAYVRALGQIELIFTFISATVFFREKVTRAEIVGILLVAAGVILIALAK